MSATPPQDSSNHGDLVMQFGDEELVIRRRYETASIANDVLIGLWFLVGTLFFFDSATVLIGTWLFLFGSIEMLIRPTIRLARHVHLKRLRARQGMPADPGTAD